MLGTTNPIGLRPLTHQIFRWLTLFQNIFSIVTAWFFSSYKIMYIKNRNNQPTASGLFRMVSDNKKGRARLPFLQNQETAFLRPERLVQSARPASPVPLRQRLRELFRRNGSGSEYRKNEQGRTGPPFSIHQYSGIQWKKQNHPDGFRRSPNTALPESAMFLENMPAIVLPDTYLFLTRPFMLSGSDNPYNPCSLPYKKWHG